MVRVMEPDGAPRVTVLGPTRVDGATPTAAQRRIIAALAVRRRVGADSDQLVDAVWGDRPVRTARSSLQNQIARLRATHGVDLVAQAGGRYHLGVECDAARFERLVGRADDARLDGRHGADAHRDLGRALALWQGTPFLDLDLDLDPQLDVERARLAGLRTRAVERWSTTEITHGDPLAAARVLAAATAEDPLHERLVELLTVALHLGGSRVTALAALEEHVHRVRRDLGVEPSARVLRLGELVRDGVQVDPATLERIGGPVASDEVASPRHRCSRRSSRRSTGGRWIGPSQPG